MSAPVSVIIPCFRCVGTVRRAVASVWQQSMRPAEVWLIDDASGDETLTVLHELEVQYVGWVRVIALPQNAGPSHARNIGWAAATQTYLAFLDADDAWHPQKIARQYAYLQAHPDVALCGHARRVLSAADADLAWALPPAGAVREVAKRWLLQTNRFVTPSVMLRRDLPQRFAEHQHYMEDHLLWLEIVCGGQRAVRLEDDLAAIYKNAFGISGLSSHLWEMGKQDVLNYGRLYRCGYLSAAETLLWMGYATLKFTRRLLVYWGYLKWQK